MLLGKVLGAGASGSLMKYGRRRVVLVASVIGIIGTSLTLKLNLWFLLGGRVLYGFACGLLIPATARWLEETCPNDLLD